MHKSKISIKLRKKIAKEYQEGKSSEQLGLEYNLSPQTIVNTVRRQGFPIRSNGRGSKISIEYRRAIAKWYQEGKTSQQLGLEYDLSPETIIKIVRSQGVKIRLPGITKGITIVKGTTEREKRNALIIEKYQNGVRVLDLCKEYNLERSHIYRIFDKHGVKVRKSGNPQGNGSFRKVPLEKYSEVVEKSLAGKTMNQLAIEYNVNRNTIRNVLMKSGIKSFKHLNCRNDVVVDALFNKAESKKDKVLTLGKQYQDLFPSEQKKFLDWIGNCCGGKPSLLADVLQTFNKDQEKTQVVCIGSVAGSILLKIAMTGAGTPFWRGCLGNVESEDLEKVRKCLVEELKQREEEIQPFLKDMRVDWMEIEKILKERKKNLG